MVLAPWIFGSLIGTGNPMDVFYGYCFAAALLFVAAGIAIVFGVKAEQRGLEDVAEPLSAQA
ncbi:hypothetical protein J2R99_000296 [Rhodopseudomonas julia]|uniref:Uncharacterized protein n=1 Tax=Rhodopseudomonas julia TaxID=200617 RepID=A0ABU0C1Q6_9BRAD|nr:hypothetical protein [Rhodopseudomonas julia]MDQ0324447.1 hypothetical protein [Rhodopseudomonas julia]